VYTQIAKNLQRPGSPISYQELAWVGRHSLNAAPAHAFGTGSFDSHVKLLSDGYRERKATAGDGLFGIGLGRGHDRQIVPENIKAVAQIYMVCQLENLGLFKVVGEIDADFINGQLKVGLDTAGQKLDENHWANMHRMTAAERSAVYSRVLGAQGGPTGGE